MCTINDDSSKKPVMGYQEHNNWTQLFTDKSRFTLTRCCERLQMWGKQRTHTHPSNIIKRNIFEGSEILFGGGIMLGIRTNRRVFQGGSISDTFLCTVIFFGEWRLATHELACKVSELKSLGTRVGTFREMLRSKKMKMCQKRSLSCNVCCKRNGTLCLNNFLTTSFSSWTDALNSASLWGMTDYVLY